MAEQVGRHGTGVQAVLDEIRPFHGKAAASFQILQRSTAQTASDFPAALVPIQSSIQALGQQARFPI